MLSQEGVEEEKEEEGGAMVVGRKCGSERKAEHQNINVRAAFIHVIGDLIQSIGVVLAGEGPRPVVVPAGLA